MMQKRIKDLTEGALYSAIYALIAILGRFLLSSLDSIIYYFIPIPIAIYSYAKNYKFSLITLFVMIAISFLISIGISPLQVLYLSIPNLILGFSFGILKRYTNNNLITFVITFLLAVLTNVLQLVAISQILGITYLDYFMADTTFITKIFNLNDEILAKIVLMIIPIMLIIDALIKSLFMVLISTIIIKRLKIADISLAFKLKFSRLLAIISMILFFISMVFMYLVFIKNYQLNILLIIFMTIYIIMALYLVLVFLTYEGSILKLKRQTGLMFLLILFGILLFPLTYIIALYYHIFFRGGNQN